MFKSMLAGVVAMLLVPGFLWAQTTPPPGNGNGQVFGISVNPDGVIEYRQKDANAELAKVKARRPGKDGANEVRFVSLVKLFSDLKNSAEGGKEISGEVKYLSGITQLRYILVYPEQNDLVIGGAGEEIDASNPMQPRGKVSGRPILQLDDLIVALRRAGGPDGRKPFGCSIDPPAGTVERAQAVLARVGSANRALLAEEMRREMGPQQVRLFGAPADSRLAFVCVAADYQLKRYTTVVEPFPLAGVGHPIDNSRPAGNGFWFEVNYDKLLVSADQTAYEIRGPRIQLKAGAIPFDAKGATERAKAWVAEVNKKIPALAAAAPIYADLQNVADLSLLAALIQKDKLAQKAKWDMGWVLDSSKYATRAVPVPRSCDTIVNFAAGSLTAGGVSLEPGGAIEDQDRERDEKGSLEPIQKRGRM